MTEYVCGFMFSEDRENVLLIQKDRPEWQAGKLNGVGGKIEFVDQERVKFDEAFHNYSVAPCFYAMTREFKEEVGIETHEQDWTHFATLEGSNSRVYCFKTVSNKIFSNKQMESEEPRIIPVEYAHFQNCVPNVPFLLRMALDCNEHFQILCNIKGGTNVR